MSGGGDHVRVIVLGDSGVGKTSFCRMMCVKDIPPEEARKATGQMRSLSQYLFIYFSICRLDGGRQCSCAARKHIVVCRQLTHHHPPTLQVMHSPPIVELWDVGGGSMITDSRHVFYDRDYHGIVLVYDASNPKSKRSILTWRQEFLSFRSQSYANRQYPELHVANKVDCITSDERQILLQQAQPADNVWTMTAASHGAEVDGGAVSNFLRFVEHLNDSRSV